MLEKLGGGGKGCELWVGGWGCRHFISLMIVIIFAHYYLSIYLWEAHDVLVLVLVLVLI